MRGEPFKRCGCKDANRKNLNNRCPRLKERGHGAWFYRYSEPASSDGKRRQPIAGPFPTKTAAENDRIERLNRMNQGLHGLTDRRVRVAADFDRWLANKDVEDSTRQSYEELGRLYIKPGLGHLRRDDLRTHHIEDLFAAIRRIGPDVRVTRTNGMLRRLLEARTASVRKPVSAARQRRVYAALHAYLESRASQGLIPRNWAEHVELATGRAPQALVWTEERVDRWLRTGRRPSPVMVWTPEQAGLFLDFAAEDRLYPLWHLIAYRGPRRGEVCGLDRSEFSRSRGVVVIRTSSDDDEVDSDLLDGRPTTKNRRSRTVALDRVTVDVLGLNLDRQEAMKKELGSLYHDSGRLFTTEDGRPLNRHGLTAFRAARRPL